jgi:hypothetical protein
VAEEVDRSDGLTTVGPGGIFISYRRNDAVGQARALFEVLEDRYGEGRVFMDVASDIPLGTSFDEHIRKYISSCAVELVLIGSNWIEQANLDRLQDPSDPVHAEISCALNHNVLVIPILIEGIDMPGSAQLPEDLSAFSTLQASVLANRSWDFDISQLVTGLDKYIVPKSAGRSGRLKRALKRKPVLAGLAVVIFAAVIIPIALGTTPAGAAGAVKSANTDHLDFDLSTQKIDYSQVPAGISVSDGGTPFMEILDDLQGLQFVSGYNFTWGNASVTGIYIVFDDAADAALDFYGTSGIPTGETQTGTFAITGISDPAHCKTSDVTNESGFSSSCNILSGNIVTWASISDGPSPATTSSMAAALGTDLLNRLFTLAESSQPPLPTPPGSTSPAELFKRLSSGVGVLPNPLEDANYGKVTVPPPPLKGLVDNATANVVTDQKDGFGDDSDSITFYIFDTSKNAASFFGSGLAPNNGSIKSIYNTSDFASKDHAECSAFTEPSSDGAPKFTACDTLTGNVVVYVEVDPSGQGYGSESVAVALTHAALVDLYREASS